MRRTLKDYPQVSLRLEDLDGQIDFIRLFGRPGPVHIEIGSGGIALGSDCVVVFDSGIFPRQSHIKARLRANIYQNLLSTGPD